MKWLLVCIAVSLTSQVKALTYSGPGMNNEIHFDQLLRYARQDPEVMNDTQFDNHTYYTSKFYPPQSDTGRDLWFDLTSLNVEVIPNVDLSTTFRVFSSHRLPFDFQFYGHTINTITVTTGGFLYTSDYLHRRIHLTQYIAPLQADFNPGLNDSASVLIYSSDERFTVQWDGVHVQNHISSGEFTFQVSLFKNGTIHFAYRDIPLLVSEISDDEHPVEVGMADSFYVDSLLRPNLILRRVFEYSRISLDQYDDLSYSAIVLDPIPGCVPADTCEKCIQASQTSSFACGWCSQLNRCSDGFDRFRQEWVLSGCSRTSTVSCPSPPSVNTAGSLVNGPGLSTGGVVGIVVGVVVILLTLIVVVGFCAALLIYGYRNPSSPLGLFMIEHRPKARSLNKSRASYDTSSGKAVLSDD